MKLIALFSIFFCILAAVSAKKDIKIELAYKLLLKEIVKQNGKIVPRADCEPSCPAGSKFLKKIY